MYILDWFTSKPASTAHDRTGPSGPRSDDDELGRQKATSHSMTQASMAPAYVQLYQPPTHASSRSHKGDVAVPTSQTSVPAPVSVSQPRPEPSANEGAAQARAAATTAPSAAPVQPTRADAALTIPTGAPPLNGAHNHQPPGLTSNSVIDVTSPAASAAAATTAAASAPATLAAPEASGRVSLKDCHSRACAGVLDTFKRTLHRGGAGTGAGVAAGAGAGAGGAGAAGVAAGASGAPQPLASASTTTQDRSSPEDAAAGNAGGAAASGAAGDAANGAAGSSASASVVECPPDTTELGRATWTFLHSVAAYYPEAPDARQQGLMRCMVEGLAEFYPCELCREHLREQVAANPPRVATAQELNLWLCGIHNEVNEMLGKPLFDCSRLGERWRDGPPDGSCD